MIIFHFYNIHTFILLIAWPWITQWTWKGLRVCSDAQGNVSWGTRNVSALFQQFFFSWVVLSEHPHFGCSFQDHAVFNAVIAQEGNWEEEQILTWTECCAPSAVLLNSYLSPWRYLSENNKLYSGCAHSLSHMFSCSFSHYLSGVLFPIKLYPENSCQLLSCSVHINPIPNTTADVWSTT